MISKWRRPRLRTLALVAAAVAALAGGATAYADDEESSPNQNNIVVAQNYVDNAAVTRTSLRVVIVHGDVTAVNEAVAYSKCTNCHTTAVAIEAIVVEGYPKVFAPQNLAVAVNDQCTACVTFADARQFDLQYTGAVELTQRGEAKIAQLRRELSDLADGGLTIDQMLQKDTEIEVDLWQVLRANLVPEDGGEDQSNEHERDSTRLAA